MRRERAGRRMNSSAALGFFGRDRNGRRLEEDDDHASVAGWAAPERGREELGRSSPRERGEEGGPARYGKRTLVRGRGRGVRPRRLQPKRERKKAE